MSTNYSTIQKLMSDISYHQTNLKKKCRNDIVYVRSDLDDIHKRIKSIGDILKLNGRYL